MLICIIHESALLNNKFDWFKFYNIPYLIFVILLNLRVHNKKRKSGFPTPPESTGRTARKKKEIFYIHEHKSRLWINYLIYLKASQKVN